MTTEQAREHQACLAEAIRLREVSPRVKGVPLRYFPGFMEVVVVDIDFHRYGDAAVVLATLCQSAPPGVWQRDAVALAKRVFSLCLPCPAAEVGS